MQNTNKKFLLSIAPLTRISLLRDQTFFYTANENLLPGTLVEIPIGKRTVKGIVINSHADFTRAGGIVLKPITQVIAVKHLTSKQVIFAQKIAHYYIAPLGTVLKSFVQEPKKAIKKKNLKKLTSIIPLTVTKEQKNTSKKITSIIEKNNSILINTHASSAVKNLLYTLLTDLLTNTKDQILILVPERSHISTLENVLCTFFPEEIITTLSTTMTKGQFFESWELTRSKNTKRIIIGTRSALFAPYENLGHIILLDEHDATHKQWEKNPRYDARDCAQILAEIHSGKYIALSPAPRITTYEKARQTQSLITLPEDKKPQTTVVDMKIEYNEVNEKKRKKAHPAIARTVRNEINKTLGKKQQILLFINRQGKNAFSVCTRCETVARCPQCEVALTESTRGHHRCLHCAFTTAIFPACRQCSALTFKSVGLGTEAIEEAMSKSFPHASVTRVDSETMRSRSSHEKLYKKISTGTVQIVIGTQMAIAPWSLPSLGLAVMIDLDTILGSYNYDTDERAFAHINALSARLSESQIKNTHLMIQSYDTEHEIVRNLSKKNTWNTFAQEELAMRKILSFPPYSEIIKLLHQSPNKSKQEKEINAVYEKIISTCEKEKNLIISEPEDPLLKKIRTRYRKQIIIKIKEGKTPESLINILKELSTEWTIDRNPVSLT